MPELPNNDEMERDVRRIISETIGRDIDRRLIAFYVRELRWVADDMRARRNIHGEIDMGNGAHSNKH